MNSYERLPGWLGHALRKLHKNVAPGDISTRTCGYFTRPTNTVVAFIADTIEEMPLLDVAELIFWLLIGPRQVYDIEELQEKVEELTTEIADLKKDRASLQSRLELIREYTRY